MDLAALLPHLDALEILGCRMGEAPWRSMSPRKRPRDAVRPVGSPRLLCTATTSAPSRTSPSGIVRFGSACRSGASAVAIRPAPHDIC
jgi:hypothetical protein